MAAVAEDKDAFRASFERFAAAHSADPAWLRERRTAAIARAVERGLPTPRDEAWRHTPTAPLARALRLEPADPAARPSLPMAGVLFRGQGFRGAELSLVNGRFRPELSSPGAGQAGVEVRSLREVLQEAPARLEPWLASVGDARGGVFSDLNTAFAEDGAVVLVAPGTIVREPVHVAHVVAGAAPGVAHARTIVVAGRGSECSVVLSHASPDGLASLTSAAAEIVVEDNATVALVRLQREGDLALHVASVAARLGRDARFADHSFALGAALSRSDVVVSFGAEGGECVLNGLFSLDGTRVSDTHSTVDHARPHCSSRELYKGLLDGRSRGVFDGLVLVRPGAQKTDAQQMNKNLLLSPEALVHSTPRLEILADDVKCKHGSTTGQLDANALFYLRSRGLDEAAARSLLTWAFASDLLRAVPVAPVRRAVETHLAAHLPGVAGLEEALA
jgi:Fe-S cluster assembly protein SufD